MMSSSIVSLVLLVSVVVMVIVVFMSSIIPVVMMVVMVMGIIMSMIMVLVMVLMMGRWLDIIIVVAIRVWMWMSLVISVGSLVVVWSVVMWWHLFLFFCCCVCLMKHVFECWCVHEFREFRLENLLKIFFPWGFNGIHPNDRNESHTTQTQWIKCKIILELCQYITCKMIPLQGSSFCCVPVLNEDIRNPIVLPFWMSCLCFW